MKGNKSTIILVIILIVGLIMTTYPMVSNYFYQKNQKEIISTYINDVKEDIDYSEFFNKSNDYNSKLAKLNNQFGNYKTVTNINDVIKTDDLLGFITINKIKQDLPIYYGTDMNTLSNKVGILEGTSIPIGGPSTHSVLTAHRGLKSYKLFTDLDKIEVGDIFTITIYNQILTYQVDQIKIVKPDESDDLKIVKDEDYVTLTTCTPYGINSHRLLIRGTRIDNLKGKRIISNEAYKINKMTVTPIICIPLLLIWILILILKPKRKEINIKDLIKGEKK